MNGRLMFSVGVLVFGYGVTAAAVEGSSSVRGTKRGYLVGDVLGFTMTPVQGGRGGYQVNQDLAVEVGYSSGSMSMSAGGVGYDFQKKIFDAKAKYFFGNSFYTDAGLAMESWSVDYPVSSADGESTENISGGSVSNTGLQLHLGNQWAWDNGMTLGCDWVGYFLSLNTSTDFPGSSSVDQEQKKQQEKDIAALVSGSSLHLTRLYLGYAF